MWRKLADVFFWLGLSLYLGGLLTVGAIVAPAVFNTARDAALTMPGIAPPLEMDRQVGGEIFGAILNRFAFIEAGSLALMLIGIVGWMFGHRHVRRSTWIIATLWAMAAAMASADAAWLRPRVWTLRTQVRQEAPQHAADAPATPAAAWPARSEFDTLHHTSETLGRAKAYVLLAMLCVTAWRGLAERGGLKTGGGRDRGEMLRQAVRDDKVTR